MKVAGPENRDSNRIMQNKTDIEKNKMSRDNETKTVRVPVFDGDEASFQSWWTRFRACAKIAGFSKVIGIDPETDAPSSQSDIDGLAGDTAENKK